MTKKLNKAQQLQQVWSDISFTEIGMRAVLQQATAAEALILVKMTKDLAQLKWEIEALQIAMDSDSKEGAA